MNDCAEENGAGYWHEVQIFAKNNLLQRVDRNGPSEQTENVCPEFRALAAKVKKFASHLLVDQEQR